MAPTTPASLAGLMLADARQALWVFPTDAPPANPAKVTITELAAAKNVADKVFTDGTYLRAIASDSVSRKRWSGANSQGLSTSNYEGQLDIARFLDKDGHADEEADYLYKAVKEKGTKLYLATRVGPKWDAAPAAKDEIDVFFITTDNPQPPQTYADFIEVISQIAIEEAWIGQVLSGE